MPSPESRSPKPNRKQEVLAVRRRYFRQVLALSRMFLAMHRDDPRQLDLETGRVLLDESETGTNHPNEILSTRTWMGQKDADSIEFITERRIYTNGAKSIIPYRDADQAMGELQAIEMAEEAAKIADPFNALLEKLLEQKTVSRTRLSVVLRPMGETGVLENSSMHEHFDEADHVTGGVQNVLHKPVDTGMPEEELRGMQAKFLEGLRNILYAAVQTPYPEEYEAIFPQETRQKIHQILIQEITAAYATDKLLIGSNIVQIRGGAECIGDEIIPNVTFIFYRSQLNDDGKISWKQFKMTQRLSDSLLAAEKSVDAHPVANDHEMAFDEVVKKTYAAVDSWQNALVEELGYGEVRTIIEREVFELNEDLSARRGSVAGQARELALDPETGNYLYRYSKRVLPGSGYNQTDEDILIQRTENPEDPSFDELEALMLLAF